MKRGTVSEQHSGKALTEMYAENYSGEEGFLPAKVEVMGHGN